ncbi:hypothetical protein LG276_16730 [Cytobacillus kochii]|uniref:hypothetical protein n=1 Tax=Cytobacillus kochii TaxID=859143 RepID=UPI00384DBB6D
MTIRRFFDKKLTFLQLNGFFMDGAFGPFAVLLIILSRIFHIPISFPMTNIKKSLVTTDH